MTTFLKNKKKVLISVISILVVLILLLPPLLILGKPQSYPREQVSIQEILLMGRITQKFRKVTQKDKQKKIPSLATIILDPDEINMLLRSSLHFFPAKKDLEWTMYWDKQDGFIVLRLSKKISVAALNATFFILPEYKNGQLTLECEFCKIGSVKFPPHWVDPYLKDLVSYLSKRSEYKVMQHILTEGVKVNPASLKVTFCPERISGQLPFLN